VIAAVDDRDEDIDLRGLATTLWKRRGWIAASAILFTVPFAVAAVLQKPLYRASTVLVDARADNGSVSALGTALGQLGNLASLARINVPGTSSRVDEALAVLRSREFTEGFIKDEELMPELFAKQWDAAAKRWKGDEKDWPTPGRAFKVFDSIRSTNKDIRSGLITVAVEWTDATKAASWVNALIARLNEEMRQRALQDTALSVGYLEKELAATSTLETRQSINRLMEAQINQRMVANVTKEFAFRVVDRALPPQKDDSISASKLLLLALGPTMGLIFGVLVVLVANVVNSKRAARDRA
jgi:uncharacterized protein involved in exopolysaccharide biosynthesis